MKKLGFIGLGIMGSGMANNLVGAGHDLVVWNRTVSKAKAVSGAEVASEPAQLASRCDLIFLCVSDTPDVAELARGPEGVIANMAGGIIVDHSTISPGATRDLANEAEANGITWIDAPVSGGSEGALNGTLSVMAGGKRAALESVRPYMEAYATSIVHVGDAPGSGQMAKVVNQTLVVLNQLAVSEALLLADAAGLNLEDTVRAVEGGAAGSWMLSNRGPQMIERDWSPGFTIDLQQKDLRLVLEAADELGIPVPGVGLVFQLYRGLQKRGLGAEGNHALVKALEAIANFELGS